MARPTNDLLCADVLTNNEFFARILLLVAAPSEIPPPSEDKPYTAVPWKCMHKYTIIQLACLGVCWIVSLDPTDLGLGLAFPLVIVSFVPLRSVLLPRWFDAQHLDLLDRTAKRS